MEINILGSYKGFHIVRVKAEPRIRLGPNVTVGEEPPSPIELSGVRQKGVWGSNAMPRRGDISNL